MAVITHEHIVALADRLNCGEITAEAYFQIVEERAEQVIAAEMAHEPTVRRFRRKP